MVFMLVILFVFLNIYFLMDCFLFAGISVTKKTHTCEYKDFFFITTITFTPIFISVALAQLRNFKAVKNVI